MQNYTNRTDNAVVSNGTLQIITKAESFGGSAYTSARLLSKDKFSFKYGKIEALAKLTERVGTWTAIWMLGNNISTGGWPACGEIDTMAHAGKQFNEINGCFHHPGHSGGTPDGSNVIISNGTTEFHKYTVEWSATTIKISVDDGVFYTCTNGSGLPFNHIFFIILNIAMGGNFGGAIDPVFANAIMEID